MVKFDTFQIPQDILRALVDMGFEDASPIQVAAIPVAFAGRDMIGQAQTGTGKTAAFGIPLIAAALEGRPGLVLCPTRELAQQVTNEIERIGKHAGIRALALYGGAAFGPQARAIASGEYQVLVATPGRLRDHIEKGTLIASAAKVIVLDEADEMLKMGFVEEVEEILQAVGEDRQTLLFSATMPEPIVRLAERYMREPEMVSVAGENDSVATANTEQLAVAVDRHEKLDALLRILFVERPTGTLIFRHTRETVDELVEQLRAKRIPAEALHGGMAQGHREEVLASMREGRVKVLVATNVAARGLDVDVISHVVNYDAPREAEAYVHRIGRTGRAGRDGRSFLFVTPADRGRLRGIERVLGDRLAWHDVPTDEQVATAVRENTAKWLAEQQLQANDDHLVIIDELIAAGANPRTLAGKLLGIVARHEGLVPPPLAARRANRAPPMERGERPMRQNGPRHGGPLVPLTLAVGRDDGVRPADIVGALTNEGGLSGADIGRIDILPRMSVAEVPEAALRMLFERMERATIRGRRAQLRVAERWEFRSPARAPMLAR